MARANLSDPEPDPGHEPGAGPSAPERKSPSLTAGLVRIARPRQWVKNLLVFVAPGAAGVLTHAHPLLRSVAGFAIFCLAASGTYFVNDTLDAEADRHHPLKRMRPVAAGVVQPGQALGAGALLMAGAIASAWWLAGWRLACVIAIYVVISTLYSLRLKHVAVLDLAGLSSGFILRAIAGGLAAGVALSDWFLIVACFGSLLIAAGKRSAEQTSLGAGRSLHRPVLEQYPPTFLRSVRLLAATVTITAYCLWAFERSAAVGHSGHPVWFELSIIPVVLTVLHLELHYDRGGGEAPEELALHDRMLQVLGVVWIALFAIGIYQ